MMNLIWPQRTNPYPSLLVLQCQQLCLPRVYIPSVLYMSQVARINICETE